MSIEALCKSIIGTANSMGIEIVKDLWVGCQSNQFVGPISTTFCFLICMSVVLFDLDEIETFD
jgi:hypothetical protein